MRPSWRECVPRVPERAMLRRGKFDENLLRCVLSLRSRLGQLPSFRFIEEANRQKTRRERRTAESGVQLFGSARFQALRATARPRLQHFHCRPIYRVDLVQYTRFVRASIQYERSGKRFELGTPTLDDERRGVPIGRSKLHCCILQRWQLHYECGKSHVHARMHL